MVPRVCGCQSRVHGPLKDFTEHGHEGDEPVVARVALAPRFMDRPCNVFAPGAGRDLVGVNEVEEISENFEPGVSEVADELPSGVFDGPVLHLEVGVPVGGVGRVRWPGFCCGGRG